MHFFCIFFTNLCHTLVQSQAEVWAWLLRLNNVISSKLSSNHSQTVRIIICWSFKVKKSSDSVKHCPVMTLETIVFKGCHKWGLPIEAP